MKDNDKKIVKRGIQRQYFPNDAGNFNMVDLKKRKVGMKKIEHQYIDRIKSASSPTRKSYTTGVKHNKAGMSRDAYIYQMHKQSVQSPHKTSGLSIN